MADAPDALRWTDAPPVEDGWYWLRPKHNGMYLPPDVVLVRGGLVFIMTPEQTRRGVRVEGHSAPARAIPALWYGPLSPPPE